MAFHNGVHPNAMVVIPLSRPLLPSEELLRVRTAEFGFNASVGYHAREPSEAMVTRFVRAYENGTSQERLDLIMSSLFYWPLLVVRATERLKELPRSRVVQIDT